MYKIIVASHGPMAEGMKKSLEFVMGPAENVTALCLDEEGISKFAERAKRLVNDQNTEEILVMVDFLFAVHLMNFQNLQRLCRKDGNYYRGKSAGTCRSGELSGRRKQYGNGNSTDKRSCGNENFKRDTCRRRKRR